MILLPGLIGARLPGEPALLRGDPDGPGPAEALVASFTVRGRVLGAVAFRRPPTTLGFDPEDLLLAADVTARTAACLENSLRFSREHIVMTALQSRPRKQPETTHNAVKVSQRHRPEGSGTRTWCDVIPLSSARVADLRGRGRLDDGAVPQARPRARQRRPGTLHLREPHRQLVRPLHSRRQDGLGGHRPVAASAPSGAAPDPLVRLRQRARTAPSPGTAPLLEAN
ncbi:hypothetical protein [Streptomyces albidochromogenes]|uniref:GAF domain-containing protein n=1 Tax=Streptomyces albidochromogenes TaxID=329524 RepID=A0ABW6FII6_9ACTN